MINEVWREKIDIHHGGVCEEGDAIEARDGGLGSAAADVDEYLGGFQGFVANADGMRTFEPRVALVDRDVFHLAQPGFDALIVLGDDAVLASLRPFTSFMSTVIWPCESRIPARVGPCGWLWRWPRASWSECSRY